MYFFLLAALLVPLTVARCFDPTPSFPPPQLDLNDPVLAQTFDYIHYKLLTAVNDTRYENVSFAVEITSSQRSLWSTAYTSSTNKVPRRGGVAVVDDKTLFAIASITKTFTVLGILYQQSAGNLSLDDSVLKYLPELGKSASTNLAWKDTTIRALASQLSGMFRDATFEDVINTESEARMLGLPANVMPSDLPTCGEYSHWANPCNASDLYASYLGRSGTYAPNQKSTYSNEAFSLLGLVIANVTGTSYSAYIQSAIFDALGMERTTFEPPLSAGIIPPGETWYGIEHGVNRPTGGIYSCTRDMSAYVRYVLTHYNGLTHGAVNWFHPQSYAEGIQSFYGMPWEIFRTDKILPSTKRPVTFVTKGGSLPGYTSRIIMSAEHDIGITILVAGDQEFVKEAMDIVTVPLIRAVDGLAMAQMGKYEGTYKTTSSNHEEAHAPFLNITLTLRTVGHSGLRITEFISNGTDVLAGATKLFGVPSATNWHLTPTLLFKDLQNQKGELWRMVPVGDPSSIANDAVWDEHCYTNVDMQDYAGVPFNEVVFWLDNKMRIEILELSGYRVKLKKETSEDDLDSYTMPDRKGDGRQLTSPLSDDL